MRYVYMLRCADHSLYTGITTDLDARVIAHNTLDTGAKYTRARRPVTLVRSKPIGTKSEATLEEMRLKKLTKSAKEKLILSSFTAPQA